MSNNPFEDLEIHPLIKAQEKHHTPAVEFRGFLGTGDERVIRLYSSLQISSSVEIPKEAIVHWEKESNGEVGKIRVFVSALTKVTEVYRHQVMARSSALSFNGAIVADDDRRPPLGWRPEPIDFWSCAGKCEGAFVRAVTRIAQLETQAIETQDQSRAEELRRQAEELKTQAKSTLWLCLTQCPPPPKFRAIPNPDGSFSLKRFSRGEVYSEICRRHMGEISCTDG